MSFPGEKNRIVISGTPEFLLVAKPNTACYVIRCLGKPRRYFALRICEFGTYDINILNFLTNWSLEWRCDVSLRG